MNVIRWDKTYRAIRFEHLTVSQSVGLDDFKPRPPVINWSACGDMTMGETKKFKYELMKAIDVAEAMERTKKWEHPGPDAKTVRVGFLYIPIQRYEEERMP